MSHLPGPSLLPPWPEGPFPGLIDIEPIHNCNLRCRTCHVPTETLTHQRLSLRAIANLGENPGAFVKLGTTHEPTTHPDFPAMVNMIGDLGMRVGLTTNGTLLTSRVRNAIADWEVFRSVSFSFDGGSRDTYEQARVGAKFDATLDRIRAFIACLDRSRTQVWATYTMSRANLHDLERAIDLWEGIGIDGMTFIAANDRPGNVFLPGQMYQDAPDEFVAAIVRAARHAVASRCRLCITCTLFPGLAATRDLGGTLVGATLMSGHPDPLFIPTPPAPRPPRQCVSPLEELRIRWDGYVRLCFDRHAPIGDLNTQSLAEIWSGPMAQFIRARLRQNDALCGGCGYYHYCLTGKNDLDEPVV